MNPQIRHAVVRELESGPRTTRELLSVVNVSEGMGDLLAGLERDGYIRFGATERWKLAFDFPPVINTPRKKQKRPRPREQGEQVLALLRTGPKTASEVNAAMPPPPGVRGRANAILANLHSLGLVRKPDRRGGAWSIAEDE